MLEENSLRESKSIGSGEVALVQNEIEVYTRQIEHEKINLRLARERYMKQFTYLQKLRGKGAVQREKFNPASPKVRVPILERSPKREVKITEDYLKVEIQKVKEVLDVVTNQSNECQLDIQDIRRRIEELRKEKLKLINLNNALSSKIERMSIDLEDIAYMNMINETDEKGAIHRQMSEMNNVLRKSRNEEKEFEDERDALEGSYQELIEIKIRKEREHHKEFLKKRPIRDIKEKSAEAKLEEEEMIRDRTPILDHLIEKYTFFNNEKRKLLERYQKNSLILKDSFDILVELLALNDYTEIPIVLEKMENQHAEIEQYCTKLQDDIIRLEKRKAELEKEMKNFEIKDIETQDDKSHLYQEKRINISDLNSAIEELQNNIERRRWFFNRIKDTTDNFMENMDRLCISEYVPAKVKINRELPYNENNIQSVISNVEDYNKFIYDLEKAYLINQQYQKEKEKKEFEKDKEKEKEKPKNDINTKIQSLKKDLIPSSFFKTDIKSGYVLDFDDIIKSKAEEIIQKVNFISENNDKKKKK